MNLATEYISLIECRDMAATQLNINDTSDNNYLLIAAAEGARMLRILSQTEDVVERLEVRNGRIGIPQNCKEVQSIRLGGSYSGINWSVQGDVIVLPVIGGNYVSSADVGYKRLLIDDLGAARIPIEVGYAIEAYCCYKYALKNFERFTIDIRNEYKKTWIEGRAAARSRANTLDTADKIRISNLWTNAKGFLRYR